MARTMEEAGAGPDVVDAVRRVHAVANAPRTAAFDDDHEPLYLHPGRSALILLIDHGVVDPDLLALAMVHDSSGAALEPTDAELTALSDLGARLVAARRDLPRSGDPHLLEDLLALDAGPLAAALAERLDHLRHLHLRPVDAETRGAWREARDVWSPVAGRVGGVFERRYGWWVRKFEGRFGG